MKKKLFIMVSFLAILFSAATAFAASPDTANTLANLAGTILPFVAIIGVFYFFMIRPQRKKEKETKAMLSAIKVGDRITTIGGVFGRVSNIKDDVITLEVGPDRAKLVFARWAIRTVEGSIAEGDSLQV